MRPPLIPSFTFSSAYTFATSACWLSTSTSSWRDTPAGRRRLASVRSAGSPCSSFCRRPTPRVTDFYAFQNGIEFQTKVLLEANLLEAILLATHGRPLKRSWTWEKRQTMSPRALMSAVSIFFFARNHCLMDPAFLPKVSETRNGYDGYNVSGVTQAKSPGRRYYPARILFKSMTSKPAFVGILRQERERKTCCGRRRRGRTRRGRWARRGG